MQRNFDDNRSTISAMSDQVRPCPTENELLARVAGTLPADRVALVDAHIDQCSNCRMVLAEAARGADGLGLRPIAFATFATNESIAGRYVIQRRLAAGGMGEVYEARDTWLDELVAIKTVVPTIADNELALARLKAEMRLARRVTHKNVCRVYDLGFHRRGREQIAFLTMELVRGTTLRRRFEKQGAFDPNTLIPILEQIVGALGHAHAEGIVHRDLKPDNVMLVENDDGVPDRVVVMDFGLARMALVADTQPLTPNSHTVLGTLDYMSPEQVQGKHAGPASDIYSLGIMLFELLTGRLPFEGESPLARALLRVTQRPPALEDALPGVDPAWSECITRCLEPEPKDRFDSIAEVGDALPRGPDRDRRPRSTRMTRPLVLAAVGIGVAAALARTPDRPTSDEQAKTLTPTGAASFTMGTTTEAPARVPSPVMLPAPPPLVASTAPAPTPRLMKRSTLPQKNPPTDPLVAAKLKNDEPDATSRIAETKSSEAAPSAVQEAAQPTPAPGNALINPFAASR
jgi:serine/threonine protein kinase